LAFVLLAGCIALGVVLAWVTGRVPFTAGDCPAPAGTTGPYQCFTIGHPYGLIGFLVGLAGVVFFGVLWSLSRRFPARKDDPVSPSSN
jgi:hypothetical protein